MPFEPPLLSPSLFALSAKEPHDDEHVISVELFAAGSSGAPPTERELFPAGLTDTSKGKFLFDEIAARSVMSAYGEQGNELPFDYDHKMLDAYGPPENGKAAGWFNLELRNGALWATNIRWTPAAEEMIRNREFRYISPAFLADRETGRVMRVVNVAITNIPATKRMRPLMTRAEVPTETTTTNAHERAEQKGNAMNPEMIAILSALLGCENNETAVMSALRSKVEEHTRMLGELARAREIVGLTDPTAQLSSKLIELVAASARVPQLEKDLTDERAITAQLRGDIKAETDRIAALALAEATREVDWIIKHAERYELGSFPNAEGAKKMLLAARAADREAFNHTYKAALEGLRSGDTDEMFRTLSGAPEGEKTTPAATSADANADLNVKARKLAAEKNIPLTSAMDMIRAGKAPR